MIDNSIKLILPDIPNLSDLEVYRKNKGYESYRKAISMTQDELINEVK